MDISKSKDLHIYESGSGGELALLNNDLVLSETLYQNIYISLFGGNIEASTQGNELENQERLDWWGNSLFFKDIPSKQFNSETERVLNNVTLNSSGRLSIKSAVENDLSFLSEIVNFSVNIYVTSINRVIIEIIQSSISNQSQQLFQFIWDNAKKEIILNRDI